VRDFSDRTADRDLQAKRVWQRKQR
jgi:hypothetical protein